MDQQQAQAAEQAKENESKFDSWRLKPWYLRAATRDGVTPAMEPTVGMQKILDKSSAATVTLEVRRIFSISYNSQFNVPLTLISKICQGYLCGNGNQISSLTIFRCFSKGYVDRSSLDGDNLLALESMEGKKEFKMRSKTLCFAIICTFCKVLFGNDSLIAKGVGTSVMHMEETLQHYNQMFIEKDFPTKVASEIATNIVVFIKQCESKPVLAEVNKEFLKWDETFKKLLLNQFDYRLSPQIKRLMATRDNKSNKQKAASNPIQQQHYRRSSIPQTTLPVLGNNFWVFIQATLHYHHSLNHLCLNHYLRHSCTTSRCNCQHSQLSPAN